MPPPAPVMIATLSWSRTIDLPPSAGLRSGASAGVRGAVARRPGMVLVLGDAEEPALDDRRGCDQRRPLVARHVREQRVQSRDPPLPAREQNATAGGRRIEAS